MSTETPCHPPGRIIILEPYFGGSHRAFLEGLRRHLPFACEFLTLPARGWKWRMRLAAPHLATELRNLPAPLPGVPCCLLCSSFVDVATLKGMLPAQWHGLPIRTYFHENQFAYPVQAEDQRDLHFGITNLTTALASDRTAFNSSHNLETFLAGCRGMVKKAPDMALPDFEATIRAQAVVLPPPLDFTDIDAAPALPSNPTPVILWNHRWEHDKNPDLFFNALLELDQRDVPFHLVVIGQSFRQQPPVFATARERLAHRLLHFGTVTTRQEYVRWLKNADLVVSTAGHEFFGLAVLEAVRAGCRPLLPNRLAYPELFPPEFLYEEEDFTKELERVLRGRPRLAPARARELTEPFSWPALAGRYREWLFPAAGPAGAQER